MFAIQKTSRLQSVGPRSYYNLCNFMQTTKWETTSKSRVRACVSTFCHLNNVAVRLKCDQSKQKPSKGAQWKCSVSIIDAETGQTPASAELDPHQISHYKPRIWQQRCINSQNTEEIRGVAVCSHMLEPGGSNHHIYSQIQRPEK